MKNIGIIALILVLGTQIAHASNGSENYHSRVNDTMNQIARTYEAYEDGKLTREELNHLKKGEKRLIYMSMLSCHVSGFRFGIPFSRMQGTFSKNYCLKEVPKARENVREARQRGIISEKVMQDSLNAINGAEREALDFKAKQKEKARKSSNGYTRN